MSTIQVTMTRPDPSHPWGFRMAGGREFGVPLTIKKVNPKSLSGRHGVQVGDRLLSIGGDPCDRMCHQDAQMAVTRSSNDLELVLLRGLPGVPLPQAPFVAAPLSPVSPGTSSWSSSATSSGGQPSPALYRSNRGAPRGHNDRHDGHAVVATPWRPQPHNAPATAPRHQHTAPAVAPRLQYSAPTPRPHHTAPAMAPHQHHTAPAMAPHQHHTAPAMAPHQQHSAAAMAPRPKQPSAMTRLEQTVTQPGRPLPLGFNPNTPPASYQAPTPAAAAAGPAGTRRGQSLRRQQGAMGPDERDPVCDACHMLIRGPFVVALERCYCPEHFRCSKCGIRMEDCGFVEEGGLLYCESDYARLLAPRCARCGLPVVEKVVTAMRQSWHPDCFVCNHCKKPMASPTPGSGEASFRVGDDNLPYCDEDWSRLFQPKCEGCGFPIDEMDQFVEAMGKNFHASCFSCSACRVSLQGKPFFTRNGKPFCKAHARAAALF